MHFQISGRREKSWWLISSGRAAAAARSYSAGLSVHLIVEEKMPAVHFHDLMFTDWINQTLQTPPTQTRRVTLKSLSLGWKNVAERHFKFNRNFIIQLNFKHLKASCELWERLFVFSCHFIQDMNHQIHPWWEFVVFQPQNKLQRLSLKLKRKKHVYCDDGESREVSGWWETTSIISLHRFLFWSLFLTQCLSCYQHHHMTWISCSDWLDIRAAVVLGDDAQTGSAGKCLLSSHRQQQLCVCVCVCVCVRGCWRVVQASPSPLTLRVKLKAVCVCVCVCVCGKQTETGPVDRDTEPGVSRTWMTENLHPSIFLL